MSSLRLGLAMLCWVVCVLPPPAAGQADRLVGVGVAVSVDDNGGVWIAQVLPGGPAARAGVKAHDELLAVDGRSVADIDDEQLPMLIRGAEGTAVTLTVRTPGIKPRKVTMQRVAIPLPQGASIGSGEATAPNTGGAKEDAGRQSGQSTRSGSQPVMRFTRVGVKDPGINNIEAVSFLVPAGWTTEGGVQWFPNYSILANLLMKVTDPHTGAQIEFLPIQNFTWLTHSVVPMQPGTNYLGNILWQPIGDPVQFIRQFYFPQALRHLQSARVVATEQLPKIAAEVSRQFGGQSTVKAARVRYEYARDGTPWEEDVYVTLVYTKWQLGTLWSVVSAYSFRAPKAQFDSVVPVMSTTIATLRLSPDWYGGYMYVQKLFNERMNQSIRNAKAISDTITRNSEEIRTMFADSYRKREESQDRISRQFSEYIRGVETYQNPFEGRPVELPSGYTGAWVSGRGEYVLSNDANFNPNVGDTIEWRRMQVQR